MDYSQVIDMVKKFLKINGEKLFTLYLRALQYSKTGVGSITVIWFNRLFAAIFILVYFIVNKDRFSLDEIANIRIGLLFFFIYLIVSGFVSVLFKEWILTQSAKILQSILEIFFYTLLFYFTKDASSDIFLCYFLPVLVSLTYLRDSRLKFITIVLAILGFLSATFMVAKTTGQQFPLCVFGFRSFFLVLVSVVYAIHKRESIVSDLHKKDPGLLELLTISPQGFFLTGLDGRLLFVNDQLQKRYGSYRKGQPAWDYFNTKDQTIFLHNEEVENMSSDQRSQAYTFVALNGEEELVDIHCSSIIDENGDVIRIAQVHKREPSLESFEKKIFGLQEVINQYKEREKTINLDRSHWLETYRELLNKMIAGMCIEELSHFITQQIVIGSSSEACALYLKDGESLSRVSFTGLEAASVTPVFCKVGEGIVGKAAQPAPGKFHGTLQYKTQVYLKDVSDSLHSSQLSDEAPGKRLEHYLAIPLNAPEETIGVLVTVNRLDGKKELAPDGYSDSDIDFLSMFASISAIAIQNIRLMDEKNLRLREIGTLYQIGDSIAKAKDYKTLLQTLVDQSNGTFGKDFLTKIQLILPGKDTLNTEFASSPSVGLDHLPGLSKFQGIAGQAIQERRTICCQDTSKSEIFVKRGKSDPAAILCVPLISSDEIYGVFNISSQKPNVFNGNHIRLAEGLADQASIALEKTYLLDKERKRAEQAEAIRLISQKVSEYREEKDLYPVVIDELSKIIPFDSLSIWRISGRNLEVVNSKGFADENSIRKLKIPKNDPKYPNYRVLKNKRFMIVDDVLIDYRFIFEKHDAFQSANIRSWMGVPIILDGRVVRMICFDHSTPNQFSEEMAILAETIATQLAIAIKNTSLNREEKRAAERLKKLNEIFQHISKSLNIDEVLKRIVDTAQIETQASHTGIVLLNSDGNAVSSIESKYIGKALHERIRPGGVTQQIIRTKQPVYFDKVSEGNEHNPLVLANKFRSYAGIPVLASEQVVAVLFVHSKETKKFSKYSTLLMTLGTQAGIAIEHAELYEREKSQKQQLDELVTFSRDLIQLVELDSLLNYSVGAGARLFQVEDCSIFITDYDRKAVNLRASSAVPAEVWEERDSFLDQPGLTAYVARTGDSLNLAGTQIQNHDQWGKYLGHLTYLPSKECHSLSLLPLPDSRGMNLGVIKFENRLAPEVGRRFSLFEVALQKSFAAVVGIAIERSRIYEKLDVAARLKVMKALNRELHELQGLIHFMIVTAASVRNNLDAGHLIDARSGIETIHQRTQNIYEQLDEFRRGLASEVGLTPSDEGLLQAIKKYNDRYLGLPLNIKKSGRFKLSHDKRYGLYKIAVEALLNIGKHTPSGTPVEIAFSTKGDGFCFKIIDHGQGFDVNAAEEQDNSYGLKLMKIIASEINSSCQIKSKINKGTEISIEGLL